MMRESFWVRWVHGVYTKGARWELFNAPVTASWTLKKLCAVMDLLKTWIVTNSYSIMETYNELMRSNLKAPWKHLVWKRFSIPKHRFVTWLAAKHRLCTKDKLLSLGLVNDDICPLCGVCPESTKHLFFDCPYSKRCLSDVHCWVGVAFCPIDKMDLRKSKKNGLQRKVLGAIYIAVIYHIWLNRNAAIWNGYVRTPQQVLRTIQLSIRDRFGEVYPMAKDSMINNRFHFK